MPTIKPFSAIRYNQQHVQLDDVVAPPYDVISPELQTKLYDRHPNNVVRLILGREDDRYASAAKHLQDWISSDILAQDGEPAIYVLHQRFEALDGSMVTRKGFVALCRLEGFDKKVVLPHEKTLSKPREDRLKLFTSTRSNLSQIFSMYWDAEHTIDSYINGSTRNEPVIDVTFESVQNKVWTVTDEAIIGKVRSFMQKEQVLIADGHHRYETALAYQADRMKQNPAHTGEEPYNYVMMFFSNIEDDGLVIYPTHRIVHSLATFEPSALIAQLQDHFIVHEVKDHKALQTGLDAATTRAFGILLKGDPKIYLATLKPNISTSDIVTDDLPEEVKELDVTLLHSFVLRDLLGISVEAQEQKTNIDYIKQSEEALEATKRGKAQISFILNATKLNEVRNVARAGHVMPQKSTYFYPKLVSGLLIYSMA